MKMRCPKVWLIICSVVSVFGISAFSSENQQTNQFFQARVKFDRLLETKEQQGEVELISDQYSASLERLHESLPEDSTYLRQCVQAEISRTAEIRAAYLKNRNRFRRVQLDYFWTENLTYKEAVADFRTVLGVAPTNSPPTDRPDLRGGFGDGVKLFGLPWLSHTDEYLERFKDEVKNRVGSKLQISMPGFPKGSFFFYAFDGDFSAFADLDVSEPRAGGTSARLSPVRIQDVGKFNRMYLVTDTRDQVVAIQFSSEAPSRAPTLMKNNEVGIFNFVLFRRKAITTAAFYQTDEYNDFIKITSILKTTEGRLLEVNVFYIPKPTVELIKFVLLHPN